VEERRRGGRGEVERTCTPGVDGGGKWREFVWERREVGWPPGAGARVRGQEVQAGKRRFTTVLVMREEGERTWKRARVAEEGVRRAGAGMRDGRDGTVSDSAGSVDAWVAGSTGLKLIMAPAEIPRARVCGQKRAPASHVGELPLVGAGAKAGDRCGRIIVPVKTMGKGACGRGSVADGQDIELVRSFEVPAGGKRRRWGDGRGIFVRPVWVHDVGENEREGKALGDGGARLGARGGLAVPLPQLDGASADENDLGGRKRAVEVPGVGGWPSVRAPTDEEVKNLQAAASFWALVQATNGFRDQSGESFTSRSGCAAGLQGAALKRRCGCARVRVRMWPHRELEELMLRQISAWGAMHARLGAVHPPQSEAEWTAAEESLGGGFCELMRTAARGDSRPAAMRSALSAAAAEVAVHISAHLRGYVPGWKTGDSSPYTPLAWWRSILQDGTVASQRYGVSVPIMDRVADFMAEAVGLKDYVPVCSLPSRSACRGTWRPCGAALEGISGGVRLLGLHSVAVRAFPAAFNMHAALGGVRSVVNSVCGEMSWFVPRGWDRVPGWMVAGDVLRVVLPDPSRTTMRGPAVWFRRLDRAAGWAAGELELVAIEGPVEAWGAWSAGAQPGRRRSRFLPPCFRWTDTHRRLSDGSPDFASGLVVKPFTTTGVLEHKHEWLKRVWPLDATCRAILDGRFYFPAKPGGITPVMRPNLRSVEEDKPLLFKMIAKYLISGALEWCPPGAEPQNLIPLGLVPKNDDEEPWWVIADGRQMNEELLPWQIPMTGMQASAGMFSRGAFCFMKDLGFRV
jgi:hypothetical protein